MWATDVLTARDGTEQRVGLRAKPRRSLEFSILVGRDDAALLDVLLSAWQSRVYALPIWPDKAFLSAAITAGSTVIPITTTNLEYEADGLLVIGSDSRNTEAAEVLSVASNAVTLKQPLLQTWPAGAFVAPARTARLRVSQAVSKVTDAIATACLVFDIAGTTAITKQESTTTFNSTAVWTTRPNRVRDVETDYRRLAEVLDFDTGITAVDDHAARPFLCCSARASSVRPMWSGTATSKPPRFASRPVVEARNDCDARRRQGFRLLQCRPAQVVPARRRDVRRFSTARRDSRVAARDGRCDGVPVGR